MDGRKYATGAVCLKEEVATEAMTVQGHGLYPKSNRYNNNTRRY